MDLEITTILNKFSQQIIFFPSFQRAYSLLHKSVESTEARGVPSCAALIGPSGSGKSALTTIFKNHFGPVTEEPFEDGIHKIIPAFYCLVPSPVTIKTLSRHLLKALGEANPKGDTVDLTYQLESRLKTSRVRVLIFDEFHRLTQRGADATRGATIEWLVALLSITGISIVLSGTQKCMEIIATDETLARRIPYIARLHYLEFSEDLDSEYIKTLNGLDMRMRDIGHIDKGVHLIAPPIYAPLYVATQGNLEYLRQILHEALESSLRRGERDLKLEDFKRACNYLELPLNLHQASNPFELSTAKCLKILIGNIK